MKFATKPVDQNQPVKNKNVPKYTATLSYCPFDGGGYVIRTASPLNLIL
jgi:hypothetical protein